MTSGTVTQIRIDEAHDDALREAAFPLRRVAYWPSKASVQGGEGRFTDDDDIGAILTACRAEEAVGTQCTGVARRFSQEDFVLAVSGSSAYSRQRPAWVRAKNLQRGVVQSACMSPAYMTPGGQRGISAGVIGDSTIRELEIGLVGSVIGPGDPNYETVRRVWNHAIDKYPDAFPEGIVNVSSL